MFDSIKNTIANLFVFGGFLQSFFDYSTYLLRWGILFCSFLVSLLLVLQKYRDYKNSAPPPSTKNPAPVPNPVPRTALSGTTQPETHNPKPEPAEVE